ncbi:MAG: hypothetical protein IMF09_03870 [Proteobacteria bacterium]|nr:hypothetical protein [Pseudomonadota bacterium]
MTLLSTKDFQVTAPALLFDPEFYIFDYAVETQTSKFLVVEEKKLELAPFVDIRFLPLAQGEFSIAAKELYALEKMHGIKRPQSAFIFHHAFVCSTLLARCLNQIDAFFSLKEPWILRRLADIKRSQYHSMNDKKWAEMFSCHLGLLAKNYHSGKAPVIKVTNVANNLIVDILRYLPEDKILYLYSDLRSFLVSNLKKPQETQVKMPGLAINFFKDSDLARKYPQFCDIGRLSFLQVCALIWVLNLYNFKSSTEQQLQNVKTLEMNDFLEDMGGSLKRLSRYFNHSASSGEVEAMLDPSVTQTNAKQQQLSYGRNTKQTETSFVLDKFNFEIEKALHWINPLVEELEVLEYCRVNTLV